MIYFCRIASCTLYASFFSVGLYCELKFGHVFTWTVSLFDSYESDCLRSPLAIDMLVKIISYYFVTFSHILDLNYAQLSRIVHP